MTERPQPPRPAVWFVSLLVEEDERSHLLGDLEEGFLARLGRSDSGAASRWYWKQVAILTLGLTAARARTLIAPPTLGLDLRRAFRSLRRSPGLSLAAVVAITVGIAGPTAAFGIISGMFSPLPVDRPRDVMAVQLIDQVQGRDLPIPWEVYAAWSDGQTTLESMGAYHAHEEAVSGEDFPPARVETAQITPGVLDVLGVAPLVGRPFDDSDAEAGASLGALIRADLWEEWFDRRPEALGAEIRVGNTVHTIVGIMPEDFGFPESERIWTPYRAGSGDDHGLDVVGRLVADGSRERARTELMAIRGRLASQAATDTPLGVLVDEYVLTMHGRRTRTLLWGLNLVVGLLVLIAAANVSALFLARGTVRVGETALRLSMGGGRWAVARPLMLEAFVVSMVGGVLGVLAAMNIVGWMGATLAARGTLPYWADLGLSLPVMAFAFLLAGGATLVAGVFPALRTSRLDLPRVMKGTRAGGVGGGTGLLPGLVATEVALACVLLLVSSFVVRGALGMVQKVGSFPIEGVLTAGLVLEEFAYPDPEARGAFWTELQRSLTATPGVDAVTIASAMPGDGTSDAWVALDDVAYDREEDWPRVQRRVVGPGFFPMFDMQPLAGRTFSVADVAGSDPVAVVNEAYALQHLGGPVGTGRRILVRERDGDPVAHEVIGVVSDPGVSVDDGKRVAAVFLPVAQRRPDQLRVALLSRPGTTAALEALSSAVAALDPDLPLDRVMTLEALVHRENDGGRVLGTLFGSLGLAAFLLAIVGLHGVVSFSTARRTYAVGVMRALGARRKGIVKDTLRRGLKPVAAGLAVGVTVSWMVMPAITGELLGETGSSPHDPLLFIAVPATLAAAAVLAVLRPALHASRVDPVAALRSE